VTRRVLRLATCVLLLLLTTLPAAAQQAGETLTLHLNRDFGYAAGGEIQGAFSLTVQGPDDLVRVEYYLDDQLLGRAEAPPFKISFSTGDYPLGRHAFVAVGATASGAQIRSVARSLEFVSAEAGWQTAGKIALPILGVVLAITLLGTLAPVVLGKSTVFRLGEYGAAGGAVCSRCGMPFSRHFFTPNIVFGKLERCPHCGKWAIVAVASPTALRQAEALWQEDRQRGELQPPSERDHLKELLDDSRYEG
jgi:DNA-directed RNA polymerase subunit RPC12/RpoP